MSYRSEPHASELAAMLMRATDSGESIPNSIDALGRACGMSARVLQRRCHILGIRARDCLRFVQCLYVVRRGERCADSIPVNDPRTLRLILKTASMVDGIPKTSSEFIVSQHFLANRSLTSALLELAETDLKHDRPKTPRQ